QGVLLGVEVVEEGARGDADGIGDVLDGDVLDAVLLGKGQGAVLQGTPSVLLLAFPPPERRGNLSRCFCHICSLCIIAATAKMSGCDMCDRTLAQTSVASASRHQPGSSAVTRSTPAATARRRSSQLRTAHPPTSTPSPCKRRTRAASRCAIFNASTRAERSRTAYRAAGVGSWEMNT